jgi:hypothetical protein
MREQRCSGDIGIGRAFHVPLHTVREAADPPLCKASPTAGGAAASLPVVPVRCNASAGIGERDTALRRKRRPLVVSAYVML